MIKLRIYNGQANITLLIKIGIVFMLCLIGYFLIRHITHSFSDSDTAKEAAFRLKGQKLEDCLRDIREAYDRVWTDECKRIGRGIECTLPNKIALTLGNRLKQQENECRVKFRLE